MIVAASPTLLADSRAGQRGGLLPWALLVIGSVASLAANVTVAEPTVTGRVIAAWPSFALIGSYELLMRQVRRSTGASGKAQPQIAGPQPPAEKVGLRRQSLSGPRPRSNASEGRGGVSRDLRQRAW
jgi:hypothetical protein